MRPRILLINPNTTQQITDILAREARRLVADRGEIVAITAPYGAPGLETPDHIETASRAVLDVIKTQPGAQAIILGAFGDPGIEAARALSGVPVFGIGRSGLEAAGKGGRRFAIITLGEKLRPSIERSVAALALGQQVVGLHFLSAGIVEVANDRSAILDMAVDLANTSVAESGAEAVLFGGAPFSGIATDIGDRVPVPVLDGLTSAVCLALAATRG